MQMRIWNADERLDELQTNITPQDAGASICGQMSEIAAQNHIMYTIQQMHCTTSCFCRPLSKTQALNGIVKSASTVVTLLNSCM